MKLFPIILAALAIVTTPVLAVDNFTKCVNKAPEVVNAIGIYCTKLGYKNVVPNGVAKPGYRSSYGGKHATVTIRADCAPGQWIPKEYCFSNFYQMCANGDKDGQRAAHWGRNGCQRWYIQKG